MKGGDSMKKHMLIIVQDATSFELNGIHEALKATGITDSYRITLKGDRPDTVHIDEAANPVGQSLPTNPTSRVLTMQDMNTGDRYCIDAPNTQWHGITGVVSERNRTRVKLRIDPNQSKRGLVNVYPVQLKVI
jgi:hypothetical protein